MRVAESAALDAVLQADAGQRRRSGADAADRRDLYEVAVLRLAADGGGVARRRA